MHSTTNKLILCFFQIYKLSEPLYPGIYRVIFPSLGNNSILLENFVRYEGSWLNIMNSINNSQNVVAG